MDVEGRDPASADEATFAAIYGELRERARGLMARQNASHTLQATALVNEAYLKLRRADFVSREAFLGLASRAMRQILVDHARSKNRQKRSAVGARVDLDELIDGFEARSGNLLELDAALERLTRRDPELARLVELRFFGGCTEAEAARVLGISVRQAGRRFLFARAFLRKELEESDG